MKCYRELYKKKKIKTMNTKMTKNSQLSTTESKKKQKQNKLSKQLEQEQNHRNANHMEGCQQGGGRGRMEGNVQGLRSIIDRYKIERGMLKIV